MAAVLFWTPIILSTRYGSGATPFYRLPLRFIALMRSKCALSGRDLFQPDPSQSENRIREAMLRTSGNGVKLDLKSDAADARQAGVGSLQLFNGSERLATPPSLVVHSANMGLKEKEVRRGG
jgi:hypothetical protein